MKNIAILGSTGSIGTQALDIVRAQGDIRVSALAAGHNVALLERQIREFRPGLAAVWEEKDAKDLKARLADMDIRVACGMDGLVEVATAEDSGTLLSAIVGMLGLRPTIAAIEAGKDIALANKETLVTAGHIIMPLANSRGARVLPVDSEHSAIFQAMQASGGNPVEKILLTASGGPFRGMDRGELSRVTPRDALRNPNWSMGKKVTVDSSTLANKGLEVMEARWLFDVDPDRIEVVVQPQSVIHSMVQFEDGGIIAQLGTPDMHLPIQYALYYPERRPLGGRLDLTALGSITFERPDTEVFRCLALAYEAIRRGGNMPTVFNAANEAAVELFLQEKIGFLQIEASIEYAMGRCAYIDAPDLEGILATEAEARGRVGKYISAGIAGHWV